MSAYFQLAPLHGVTNRVYREAWFASFGGLDSAMAPFVLAIPGSSGKRNHFKDVLPPAGYPVAEPPAASFPVAGNPGTVPNPPQVLASPQIAPAQIAPAEKPPALPPPLVPQLLGNDPACFVETSRVLAAAGYREVNWNLGCPYSMVANKFRGSGLLPHPERIERFLEGVFSAGDIPAVSVKIRLGRASSAEWHAFMPVLNRYPLASVTIHARIGAQLYRGSVDLEEYARAAASCAHPVVYNGDIVDLASFRLAERAFPGASGYMIGRGALADPFLPARIRASLAGARAPSAQVPMPPAPGSAEWLAAVARFHDDLFSRYRSVLSGPAHVLDKMKEVWTYLAPSLPRKKRELAALSLVRGFDDYRRAVDSALSPQS